jgi:hypothetical protein
MATVQTLSTANVGDNSLEATGNLMLLGDGLVTDHGFCYSSSSAMPTISNGKASKGQTTQTGRFTVEVTGLQASTKYYLRAYATNSMGTAYGTVIEATTTDAPPVVTNGLVAYYTFDSSNCNEARGNTQYNGLQQGSGSPVWSSDIPNSSGKSLQLSNDAYFQMPTNPYSATSASYSTSIWLKTMSSNCFVFQHSGFNVYLLIKDNKVTACYYYFPVYFDIDVSNLLLDGNWHLLTISKNSTGIHKLYIDGTYYSSVSDSYTNTSQNPLKLGQGFTGKMDNFRVYNRELTQSEITEIYNAKQ